MKNKRIAMIAISLILLVSLMLPASISAAAAGSAGAASDYSIAGATGFVFSDSGIAVTKGASDGYQIEGTALTIEEGGVYVVSGSCANGTIVVKKDVTGVTLVLNGLTLSASATAPITCNKGSEVRIVAAAGSVNSLADDRYNNDEIYTDETLYPDVENAVIKCKDGSKVTICGAGTVNITANGKNGVKGGADLYEGDTLLSEASLTVMELTLNITAEAGDGLKADKALNLLSGNVTVTAADDGICCDYVMNIGAEDTEGPTVTVAKSAEGLEAATLNVYSGSITVNATDDGVNAANSELRDYSFSYNQYGGYVYVNVTNGDGVDSNGTINLIGGTLEVYTPSQGDGDPLDAEGGTSFKGATVLAVGHLGMAQGYSAETAYVTFGSGASGGFGAMGGSQNDLVTAGSAIQITDESGKVLYTAKALRSAGYVLFASPDLASGSAYTLKNGTSDAATATAGTASTGGMAMGGQMRGSMGGNQGMMPGGKQNRGFPGQDSAESGELPEDGAAMPRRPGMSGGELPVNPDGSEMPAFPDGETPPEAQSGEENGSLKQMPEGGEGFEQPADSGETDAPALSGDSAASDEPAQDMNWFQSAINAIASFFRSVFGKH